MQVPCHGDADHGSTDEQPWLRNAAGACTLHCHQRRGFLYGALLLNGLLGVNDAPYEALMTADGEHQYLPAPSRSGMRWRGWGCRIRQKNCLLNAIAYDRENVCSRNARSPLLSGPKYSV